MLLSSVIVDLSRTGLTVRTAKVGVGVEVGGGVVAFCTTSMASARECGAGTGAGVGGGGAHLQTKETKGGRRGQFSTGICPICPASSRTPHGTGGPPKNAKIASGRVTDIPSPQTAHGGKIPGDKVGGGVGGVGAVGGGGAVGLGLHPQIDIKGARKGQLSIGICPFAPASCRVPQGMEG